MNESIYSNISFALDSLKASNLSIGKSFAEVCELNQVALLQEVQGYPSKSFWLVATMVFCLALYLFVLPRFKEGRWRFFIEQRILWIGFATGSCAVFLMMYTTFTISDAGNQTITYILIGLAAFMFLLTAWDHRHKFIKRFK